MLAKEKGHIKLAEILRQAMVNTERPAILFPPDFIPPLEFRCPITCEIFQDPVILGTTGHTFERKAITDWLTIRKCDPLTNEPLANTTLSPDNAMLEAIQQLANTIIPAAKAAMENTSKPAATDSGICIRANKIQFISMF